jgi:hypothetical protein
MAMKAIAPEAMAPPADTIRLDRLATQRQIIRDGTITVEAADSREAAKVLSQTVTELGGFLGNASESVNELGGRTVTVEARVPAARFDALMQKIEKLGTVLERNVTAQDVTEEYVDVEAKLRNLRRTEDRLLAHLARSGKLSDTLLVERELTRIREQIEQHDGRMRFLKHHVAFSSATAVFRDKARREPIVPPESFSSGQVASSATRALVDFARSVWTTVIWVAIWSPVWIVLLLAVLRLTRRRRPKP